MQFAQVVKDYELIDIVSVDDTHYAIATRNTPVPGCTVLPVAQLHTRLREFLLRGYSQRYRQAYRVATGLVAWTLCSYTLTHLPPTRKQTFSHALMGAAGKPGLLAKWGGQKLGRSAFLVPLEREAEAIAFLTHWAVDYSREVVFRG